MSTLPAPRRVIKLKVQVDPDRRCSNPGCRYLAPAPGPWYCAFCRSKDAIERVLRRAADAGDEATMAEIAEVAEGIEGDAAFMRSRRPQAPAAVREVRDPILPTDGEDYDRCCDPNGPSPAAAAGAAIAGLLASEL